MSPKKELLWGLWVYSEHQGTECKDAPNIGAFKLFREFQAQDIFELT